MKGGTTMIAFVQGPDGYKIELIERPKKIIRPSKARANRARTRRALAQAGHGVASALADRR